MTHFPKMIITSLAVVVLCGMPLARADKVEPPSIQICTVSDVEGKTVSGELVGLTGETVTLLTANDETVVLPLVDIVRARFDRQPQRKIEGVVVELVGGDRIVAAVYSPSEDDSLKLQSEALGSVEVSLLDVHRIIFQTPKRAVRGATNGSPNTMDTDALVLKNGDILDGFVSRVEADSVTVMLDDEPRRVNVDLVQMVTLAADGWKGHKGLHLAIRFADGSRITMRDARLNGDTLTGTWFETEVTANVADVTSIRVLGGRWRDLSERDLIEHHYTPLRKARFEHQFNRSVMGGPLRVGSRKFEHGIGVHSPSTLVFEVADGVEYFVTQFGLDDAAGPMASVDVRVRVDGEDVFNETVATVGQLHASVRVPVQGRSKLELVVEPGQNLTVQDRLDWIEPGFVLHSAKTP